MSDNERMAKALQDTAFAMTRRDRAKARLIALGPKMSEIQAQEAAADLLNTSARAHEECAAKWERMLGVTG